MTDTDFLNVNFDGKYFDGWSLSFTMDRKHYNALKIDRLNFDGLAGSIKTSKFPPVKILGFMVINMGVLVNLDVLLMCICTLIEPFMAHQDMTK